MSIYANINLTGQWNPIRDPWETDYAALVPRFSGGLSSICSFLIICIILSSSVRLSTTYHRILMGMSIADVVGSTAMALTSLPMPTKMPFEEEFSYSWAGTRLGNTQTCNVQGFSFQFGFTSAVCYNTMLCIYYACAIAFKMNERIIHKRVEPILHFVAIACGLAFAILPLLHELYNPSNSTYAWCGVAPYPHHCTSWKDVVTCIRGNEEIYSQFMYAYMLLTALIFVTIFLSLTLVILRVYRNEKDLKKIIATRCSGFDHDGVRRISRGVSTVSKGHCRTIPSTSDIARIQQSHKNTQVIIYQALAYFSVIVLEFIVPFIRATGWVNADDYEQSSRNTLIRMDKVFLLLLPMQGVFNLMIFISHKVYNYRRANPNTTICCALRKILFSSKEAEPYLMSRISIVKSDSESNDDVEMFEISICSEVEERTCHRFALSSLQGHLGNSGDTEQNKDHSSCNNFLPLSSSVRDSVSSSESFSSREALSLSIGEDYTGEASGNQLMPPPHLISNDGISTLSSIPKNDDGLSFG